jgi:hypothetical protein
MQSCYERKAKTNGSQKDMIEKKSKKGKIWEEE